MVYDAEPPDGAVYVKIVGLGAVPETVSAVVPSVSVNTPDAFTEIRLPFLSVAVPAPVVVFRGGTVVLPSRAMIVDRPEIL